VAIALVCSGPASARPAEEATRVPSVRIVKAPGAEFSASGEVVGREESGGHPEVRVPFEIPGGQRELELEVPLPSQGRWWFSVLGQGLFSRAELLVFPLEVGQPVLQIRPLVRLAASVVAQGGVSIEDRETLVLWRTPGSMDRWESAKTRVSGGRVEAESPAGTWDLAIKVRGCASYRREGSLAAPGARLDLGTVTVVPGASFVGRVASPDPDTRLRPKEVRVTLSPAGEVPGRSSVGDGISLGSETRPTALGEFQFAGLTPGRYNLRVFAPGFAREDRVVDISPDLEVELRDRILLARPAILQVDVSPGIDPRGLPWVVELRETGEAGWFPDAGLSRRPAAGTAVFDGLRVGGEYVAIIRTGKGDSWRMQAVTMTEPRTKLAVRLDGVALVGRLTLGGEPLRARLYFGGKMAVPSIRTASGEDGEFRAHLPRNGRWTIDVDATTPRVSRSVAVEVPEVEEGEPSRVLSDIPPTRLRIRVVDARGVLVARHCFVRLESVATQEQLDEETSTGELETFGLEPGEWIAHAESARAVSDRRKFTVEKEGEQELTLTLAEKRTVEGVVVSSLGTPVPYSRLQMLRWDSRLDTFPSPVMADALGRFKLQVPAEVARVGVLVQPPGHAVTTVALSTSAAGIVAVEVPSSGGRVAFSFDSKAYPPPRMPWVSDGTLTFWAFLLTTSPETRVEHRDGRTFVEVPSYRPGPFGVCQVALAGASDLDQVGQGCLFGAVAPGRDLVLEIGDAGRGSPPP
jgi:hypothetical protein